MLFFLFLFFFLSSFKLDIFPPVPVHLIFSSAPIGPPCAPTASSSVINLTTSRCLLRFCPQLLDLFMVWDWSTYLADYGQPSSKYLRVNPATALALLEKWVPLMSQHLQGKRARSFIQLDVTCLTTSLDEAPHTPPFVIWTQQTHNIMHVLQLLPRLLHFLQVWLLQFSSVSRLPSPLLFWCYFLSTWSLSSLGDTSSQLCWWPASAAWWGDFKRTKCPKCLLSVHLTH